MKKIIFLFIIICSVFALNGFAQQESADSCIQSYKGQLAKGYNALAMAIDNGYFVCGFAFGGFDKVEASKKALAECETNRLNPNNEVQGKRKIMTHCRIYQFQNLKE